tara:strand:- start:23699 stop:25006 length:1308 start_codon:yes stop_codon:yes gene_type:complete
MGTGQDLYIRAKQIIPGGTQLLSKRPEMFLPDQWPAYYTRAKGSDVWDLEGRRFIDCSIGGVSACPLGYADPDVEEAVVGAVKAGSMSTLNCPEEVELAELLLDIHEWADMVRYARSGGEIMAVAARIARAATGRTKIAFCGYHGWHDWYLAANLGKGDELDSHLLAGLDPAGVPAGLQGTMLPFEYNRLDQLEQIVGGNQDIAAIVMEPVRYLPPAKGFLEGVRKVADQVGAVLVFDEITSGWKMNVGGIHLTYGVNPDLAIYAKAIANGHAMAAVVGRESVMSAAQATFISSTNWTERIGPAAALATIRKLEALAVPASLIETGNMIREGWLSAASRAGLELSVGNIPPLSTFSLNYENALAIITLFNQEMLDRGFLATSQFVPTLAHTEAQIACYFEAVDEIFPMLVDAIENKKVEVKLRGPIKHSGFERLN